MNLSRNTWVNLRPFIIKFGKYRSNRSLSTVSTLKIDYPLRIPSWRFSPTINFQSTVDQAYCEDRVPIDLNWLSVSISICWVSQKNPVDQPNRIYIGYLGRSHELRHNHRQFNRCVYIIASIYPQHACSYVDHYKKSLSLN